MSTLAIIPAKRHSVGVPDKNWKPIAGRWSCTELALVCGGRTCDRVLLSTDLEVWRVSPAAYGLPDPLTILQRPPDLPDTMLAVVQHALEAVPGPDDEIIVLLQPSSPLRTAETVRKAIQMLEEDPNADSVVSVSLSYPWQWSLIDDDGRLFCLCEIPKMGVAARWSALNDISPDRRQDCEPTYKRDGVVYAFRRSVLTDGSIYGNVTLAFHTPPAEALSIDTQADWDEAVRRLSNSAGSQGADTSAHP